MQNTHSEPVLNTDRHPSSRNKYQGFSLSSVCWGYRDIFAKTLEGLFEQGLIGDQRPRVTDSFFALMRCAKKSAFDHVLKEFLTTLNPQTAWIMDLPGVFVQVTETGRQFAESKLHYGISYFHILGEGGLGSSPQQVCTAVAFLRRLLTIDDGLALSFLKGYRKLVSRLTPPEIEIYVREGMRMFHQNKESGLRFLEGALKSSEYMIQSLTRECRLEDVKPTLARLLRALVGYEVEIGDPSSLDSDELIEHNTRVVCMYQWLYLPLRVRYFDQVWQNRNWYLLMGVVAAGMLALHSFSCIHGHPDYATCADLVGHDRLLLNLFQLVEYVRVLQGMRSMWPGAQKLVDFGIATEYNSLPPKTLADRLFFSLMMDSTLASPGERILLDVANASVNAFDTASLLTPDLASDVLKSCPGLDRFPLRTLAFLPDFLYPAQVSQPSLESLVADLKQKANQRRQDRGKKPDERQGIRQPGDKEHDEDEKEKDKREGGIEVCFVYDEWSQDERDYYLDYCRVYEKRPSFNSAYQFPIPERFADLASKVRRIFELLRPELVKEKYLSEGDRINVDLLTEYLVLREKEPSPKINFYEKPFRNRRDLAVLILLDVSGSTGEGVDHEKTIEVEKHAALILGQGLDVLGDRFAVCGFSGTGRKNCEFFVFKGFDDPWNQASKSNVLSAYPRSSTRIGAALRHAGYRLSLIKAKQRLVILITDGKPMDTEYDPNTGYAQYDVRMACGENKRKGIHTFCVSTNENTLADMNIMFPDRMFAILPDIRRLPHILPRLYIKMTV